MRRRRFPPGLPAVLVLVALVAGIYLGGHPDHLPGFARKTLVADTDGRLYQEAVDEIHRDYYKPVGSGRLLDTSIGAAVASLKDPYSHYFSPHDYGAFEDDTNGRFQGIGTTVSRVKQGLKIDQVYAHSPASRGGLHAGDIIVSVNGVPLAGKTSDQSTKLIKGPAGTSVKLGVRSDGRLRRLTLLREEVDIPVVESKLEHYHGEPIGWVHLAGFTAGAHGEVATAVQDLLHKGAKGFVFDLRDNGGGLLDEAVQIASIFVPDGRIVSTKGRNRPEHVYNATGGALATKHADGHAGQRQHRVGVGDRHGRAAGPQARGRRGHAHVRQGRLPGDRAAVQRRRAGHHGRRVLHPERAQPGRRRRQEGRGHHARHPGR